MNREYYSAPISVFLPENVESVLGKLLIHDEFETTDLQKNAWRSEIEILKRELAGYPDGEIAFEYTIPRIGRRIDVVCIIRGVIFLLEFKVGDREYKKSTDDQVMDYALDLKYFHEASADRYIVPVSIATEALPRQCTLHFMDDKIADNLHCSKTNIGETITSVLSAVTAGPLSMDEWKNARYAPTPTIIEAAQALYRNHTVDDITKKEAGKENLTATSSAISEIIERCKKNREKAICFVTGVPGAGKTLAGLNIANERHQFESDEHAVFLSGNGPLVDVLQEALAKDRSNRDGIRLADARRETKAFIQIVHKFRDEALSSDRPPIEKVAIFDEAQRAWDEANLADFMKRKRASRTSINPSRSS